MKLMTMIFSVVLLAIIGFTYPSLQKSNQSNSIQEELIQQNCQCSSNICSCSTSSPDSQTINCSCGVTCSCTCSRTRNKEDHGLVTMDPTQEGNSKKLEAYFTTLEYTSLADGLGELRGYVKDKNMSAYYEKAIEVEADFESLPQSAKNAYITWSNENLTPVKK